MILNVGAGNMEYGDVRIDIFRGEHVEVLSSGDQLPFRDASFHEVYSRCVLEHLPNALAAIMEQARVCTDGGTIDLVTDNASFWGYHVFGQHTEPLFARDGFEVWRGSHGSDRHYALYTPEHLRNLFERAGLEVKSVEFEDFGTKRDTPSRMLRLFVPRRFTFPRIHVIAIRPSRAATDSGADRQ